jgi:short-subunit dehydrogenase
MKIGAMDARSVAQAGYEAMMAGRLNAVPGWKNRLSAVASMLTPSREILLRIAGKIFDSAGAPA